MTSVSEKIVIDNMFGVVTNKRVTYFANKSWFGGGSREDVPLKQVVSVRYEIQRRLFMGLFLTVVGIAWIREIFGIIPLLFGILFLWGSPRVNVVTSGGTATPVIGWPWQRKQASDFSQSLRRQLFDEE